MWPKQAFRISSEVLDAVSQEEVDATYADMEKLGLAQPPYEEFDIIINPYDALSLSYCGGSGVTEEASKESLDVALRRVMEGMDFMGGTSGTDAAHTPLRPMGIRYKNGECIAFLKCANSLFNKFEVDYTFSKEADGWYMQPHASPSSKAPELVATDTVTGNEIVGSELDVLGAMASTTLEDFDGKQAKPINEHFFHRIVHQSGAERLYRLLIVLLATKNAEKEVKECKGVRLGVGKGKHNYVTSIRIGKVTEVATGKGEATGTVVRPHLRRGHERTQHFGPNGNYIKKIFIQPVFVNADADWVNARTAYNVSVNK